MTLASEGRVHRPADGAWPCRIVAVEIDQQIPALITKLKAAGVNNLIMMASNTPVAPRHRRP